jgi:hypothetical protein
MPFLLLLPFKIYKAYKLGKTVKGGVRFAGKVYRTIRPGDSSDGYSSSSSDGSISSSQLSSDAPPIAARACRSRRKGQHRSRHHRYDPDSPYSQESRMYSSQPHVGDDYAVPRKYHSSRRTQSLSDCESNESQRAERHHSHRSKQHTYRR